MANILVFLVFLFLNVCALDNKTDPRNVVKRQGCSTYPKYDIECHGSCPRFDTSDWTKNKLYTKCSVPKTYHCAFNRKRYLKEGCVKPISCINGTEPILFEKEGSLHVECKFCHDFEKHLNTMKRQSDSFSECFESRVICKSKRGEEECQKMEGDKIYYTQTKCSCNWRKGYVPQSPELGLCTSDMTCYQMSCPDNQVRLSDFECHPECEDGMERINNSNICVPIPDTKNVTDIINSTNKEDNTSISTFTPTPTVEITSSKTKLEVKNKENHQWLKWVLPVVIIIVVLVAVICCYCVCYGPEKEINCVCCNRENREINCVCCNRENRAGATSSIAGAISSIPLKSIPATTTSSIPMPSNSAAAPTSTGPVPSTSEEEPLLTANDEAAAPTSTGPIPSTSEEEPLLAAINEGDGSLAENVNSRNQNTPSHGVEIEPNISTESTESNREENIGDGSLAENVNSRNQNTPSHEDEIEPNISTENTESNREENIERQRKRLQEKLQGTTGLEFRVVCRDVLNEHSLILKQQMTAELQDQLRAKKLFDHNDLMDLMETKLTTEKNELIFRKVYEKYVVKEQDNYHLFKECLDAVGQGHLVDKLEKSENEIIANEKERKRKRLQEKLHGITDLEFRVVCRYAIKQNRQLLIETMTAELQDQLRAKNLFTHNELRDLRETKLTTEKNELIFHKVYKKVVKKDKDSYHLFKECLDAVGQGHLVDKLEKSEDEIIANGKNETDSDDPESNSEDFDSSNLKE